MFVKQNLNTMNKTFNHLTPETLTAVKSIAETIQPILDDIHAQRPTTQNYYGDYMRVLSYASNKGKGYVKLLALAMLYAGCNPSGLEAATKNVI
jgi:thiaminase